MAKKKYDKPRNYISGSAVEKVFSEDFSIINIDMLLSDVLKLPVNPKGYIKICVANVKGGEDRYGNTHSVYENDFVPDPKKKGASSKPTDVPYKGRIDENVDDDLPF